VPGLSPETEYEVYCKQNNSFGWSLNSQFAKFRTRSDPADEPEVTGVQTQEERDREALKRASTSTRTMTTRESRPSAASAGRNRNSTARSVV